MTVIIDGTTGISPVTASGTSASVDGMTVGRGGGEVATNTVVGYQAANSNTTGGSNVAVGTESLASNTTASYNTAVGYRASYSSVTGSQITAIGFQALKTSTGNYNSAFGSNSQRDTSTGAANTSVGVSSMLVNTTGSNNVAVGADALVANTTASNNTAVGYQAGYSNTTGITNTFVGSKAGYATTTNSYNTFIGEYAGYNATSAQNTFVGEGCAYLITSGAKNTVIGRFDGNQSGLDIRTANNYIVLSDGDGTWRMYFNGSGAPYLGAVPSGSNATLQWNSGTGAVTYLVSSEKYKTNIQDTKYGLADVLKMRAVTFNHLSDGTPDVGVIAEEMVNIVPEVVGLKDGQPDYVGYERLSSIFIKAIQELKAELDATKAEVQALKAGA